jgi:hypothetical protein
MAVRAVVAFLILAAVWTLGLPQRVEVDELADPDAIADARGLPDPLDAPDPARRYAIDPAPHRAALEAVEDVLYRRGPSGYGDAGAVESGAVRLAHEVMASGGLAERQAGLELLAFAGRVGAEADAGYALPSLVRMREQWEPVRDAVFAPAPWLRTASADLDRIQDPPPEPMDPRTDAVLAEAEAELRRLMARGEREVELLGEPVYDPDVPSRSDGGQIRAWVRFGERWRRLLADAMAPVEALSPAPDPGREPLRAEAVRSLREAHEMLRRVPNGAGMWPTPFRGAWESRFHAANAALARTRDHLSQAGASSEGGEAHDHARWSR